MKHYTIYAFIILFFLQLDPPSLYGQDAYTRLKDKYSDGTLTEAEYSQNLKSLYLTLLEGNYRAEPGERAIKCLFGIRAEATGYMSQLEKSALAAVEQRPETQAFYVTPEGHFKIHYDTTGVHAIPRDSIPDWIEYTGKAYERGWTLLIDSLGYNTPPVDSVDGNEVDVYIQNLAPGDYGIAFWEQNQTSYIIMDNDFAEDAYFSNDLDGMRVTAVHEFFHVVQLGYALPLSGPDGSTGWYYELAATWFEDVGYDEVNDYLQYISDYYRDVNTPLPNVGIGYELAIWGKFLEENYSAAIMRNVWEQMAENSPEVALDNALKSTNSEEDGMKAAFGKFALWNWFTGSRSITGVFFEEASLYPELTAATDTTLSDVTVLAPLFGLNQLAFRIHRFEPTRSSAMKAHFTALGKSNVWGSTMTGAPPQIVSLPPGISTHLTSVNSGTGLIIAAANGSVKSSEVGSERYTVEVTLTGVPPSNIIAQYPNPFNTDTKIDFDLGAATSSMVFTVFDILGHRVYREPLGDLDEGENYVRFIPDVELSNGLYLYRLAGTGVEINGKFTLMR